MNKKIIICIVFAMCFLSKGYAQSGTNSPYSMYGLGILSDRSQGFNRGMAGVAQGFRGGSYINMQNPASYSNIDSLSFIFDAALSLQNMNIEENGNKANAKNANFEYVVAAFRVAKHLGASFGIMPFTNIGYDFTQKGTITDPFLDVYENNYYGSGGIREVYLGLGWNPFKGLSIGFNAGYLWGDMTKTIHSSHSISSANSLNRIYSTNINSYTFDFGLQYEQPIKKDDRIIIGATYTLGHNLGNTAYAYDVKTDTTSYSVGDAYSIPHIISAGVGWHHKDKWSVGIDYTMYKFGDTEIPDLTSVSPTKNIYAKTKGLMLDRHKIAVGGEWVPNAMSRRFLDRVHYRLGGYYATPYIKVYDHNKNLVDGPKEYGLSFGFGIPIINTYNSRSLLNISGQWVHSGMDSLIKENYLRLTVGLTFNERWFAKWKFD